MPGSLRSLCWLILIGGTSVGMADEAPTPAQLEFFEKQVRPVLVARCIECHGGAKQQGGLRLDSRSAMLKGNDSGPVLTPGQPADSSRMLQVLKYSNDDVQMPPTGKLPEGEIAILREWIQQGAPWPAGDKPAGGGSSGPDFTDLTVARNEFWSLQPIRRPVPPSVEHADRVQSPVDAFMLQKLEAAGLTLAAPADRYTLLRRLTLDLWGIPPTWEDMAAFMADERPNAVERAVDRLLDSPLYGQRWGRYWLDVARYADTKGYVFTEEPRYPYAYTYRDYVVDAFNSDKPYDQFVQEQLAADQLDLGNNPRTQAALGFLTVGRRFLNNQNDIIDDRIDVVSRGLLGLTVSCARCHDHKFDPVPTDDYYSLYGIFASSHEPGDLPIIGEPRETAAFDAFQAELTKREQEVTAFNNATSSAVYHELRTKVSEYLEAVGRKTSPGIQAEVAGKPQAPDPRRGAVDRWQGWLAKLDQEPHPVFAPWQQLSPLPAGEVGAALASWKARFADPNDAAAQAVNPVLRGAWLAQPPESLLAVTKLYGKVLADIEEKWKAQEKANPEATALPDAADESLRQVLYGNDTPTAIAAEEAEKLFNRAERDKQRQLKRKVDELKATSPGAPPRAMVMRDNDNPVEPVVLIRGNPGRRGKQVPRRFLQVLSESPDEKFQQGSGRLELARSITDPKNPLTARVMANRLWQHHFGRGIVATPGDFGVRGEPPTHPELLDWLAVELQAHGWSLKSLQRQIVLSSVYQQSSRQGPAAGAVDPENRLLSHMPRQRLDFEALRDSLLAAGGGFDPMLDGRPLDNVTAVDNRRRTIYSMVNRNDLPGVFRSFDFADPDTSAPERPQTTVPQQALFGLNSPFVIEQARRLAGRSYAASDNDAGRLQDLYRRAYARDPSPAEVELGLQFVQNAPTEKITLSPWDRLAQILLLTNEFVFVD